MSVAFCEELTLFFQGPRQDAIKVILEGARVMNKRASAELRKLDPEQLADHLLTRIGLSMSGDLSALSASPPAKPGA
jgi:hypothetical protein